MLYETFPIFFSNKYRLFVFRLQRHLFQFILSGYRTFSISVGLPLSYGKATKQCQTKREEKKIAENRWNIFLASSNFVGMSEYYSSFIKRSFILSSSLSEFRIRKFFKYWPTKNNGSFFYYSSYFFSFHSQYSLFFCFAFAPTLVHIHSVWYLLLLKYYLAH